LPLAGKRLAIAMPDTVLEERDSLRDKTTKLGQIARACSIYGVDRIEVFKDEKGRGQPALIKKVLEYLETPPYLRKRLYSLDESLKFAGLLPPLKIPSHKPKVPFENLAVGEFREGVANQDGTVDIGLDRNPRLGAKLLPNRRVTVRVVSISPPTVELASRDRADEYWGYVVEIKDAKDVLVARPFEVTISTSRFGTSLRAQLDKLTSAIREAGSVKLVFGSPRRGLFELFGPDLVKKSGFVVNLFAGQEVETVRSEEAIFAGLSLVNFLVS
jgi:methyltransferase